MVRLGVLVVELLGRGDEFLDVGQPLGVLLVAATRGASPRSRSSRARARITSSGGRSSRVAQFGHQLVEVAQAGRGLALDRGDLRDLPGGRAAG